MKALLCGVLCAGLLGQAPVHADNDTSAPRSDAELRNPGHLGLSWQRDDADGDAKGLSLALPLSPIWYLNASMMRADNEPDTTSTRDESITATIQRLGVSLDRDGWGGSLSLLRYDDHSVLETQETQATLRHRGEHVEWGLELATRQHDVTLEFPNREFAESFDSRGWGLHVSISADSGMRGYAGLQQYDYDDAQIFDTEFKRLLQLINQYPALRDQILRTYNSALAQQNQAQGTLAHANWWLGLDVPIRDHFLTLEHFVSEAEIDGSTFTTDSVILALTMNETWGLDISAGVNRGDNSDDSRFAGIALHLFW